MASVIREPTDAANCRTRHHNGAGDGDGDKLPEPADLSHHFNAITRSRKQSAMKGLYKYFQRPGMANLAGGLPHPGYFPYDTLEADVAGPERFLATAAQDLHAIPPSIFARLFKASPPPPPPPAAADASAPPSRTVSDRLAVPKFGDERSPRDRIDLATTLQYGQATGLGALAAFLGEFALQHLHGGRIPYAAPGIVLTCGATDGFSKVMQLFAAPGVHLLVEEVCYTNALQTATALGASAVPVRMDGRGLRTEGAGGLRDVLENWDGRRGRKPSLLYTVSVGQNPTGATLSLERRRDIYRLCETHDVLIVEDDPYWHLQYQPHEQPGERHRRARYPFLAALTPSFVTLDVSGRVLRLDTLSKTIAPGCRLGWITAQPRFVERLLRVTENSTQQPSGFAQAAVATLLCRTWRMDGWVAWLAGLRAAYQRRMHAMCDALHAGSSVLQTKDAAAGDAVVVRKKVLFDFARPDGGMFVWVRVRIAEHPAYREFVARGGGGGARKALMLEKLWDWVALTQHALPSPGAIFAATPLIAREAACEHFRFCFAAIHEDELVPATERFVRGVRTFWTLRADEIENVGLGEEGERCGEGEGLARVRDLAGGLLGC